MFLAYLQGLFALSLVISGLSAHIFSLLLCASGDAAPLHMWGMWSTCGAPSTTLAPRSLYSSAVPLRPHALPKHRCSVCFKQSVIFQQDLNNEKCVSYLPTQFPFWRPWFLFLDSDIMFPSCTKVLLSRGLPFKDLTVPASWLSYIWKGLYLALVTEVHFHWV